MTFPTNIEIDQKEKKLKEKEQELLQKEKELEKKEDQLKERENSLSYLLELNDKNTKELFSLYNSKYWKMVLFYRKIKGKFTKLRKNPTIIFRKFKDYFRHEINFKVKNINIDTDGDNPLVSVIIPVYDRTDILRESIESILNQSFSNFELLLICDGSPKETIEIVRSYEKNPRIRAFYFKNNSGNAVRGRNKGIIEARGKYIAFQDSDDTAEIDRLKLSIYYMQEYNVDIVYGGWRAIVDGTRKTEIKNNQIVYSPDCDYEMLLKICVPCQSTVMARTDALRAVGGLKTKMKYREDHELWLRLAYKGYKFKSIHKVLTNLRLHNNNLELRFKEDDEYWNKLMLEEHENIVSMKPKIAYVIPGCEISGGIGVVCQHANRLLKRGFDVILISVDGSTDINWFPNQQVEIITIDNISSNLDIVIATGWSTAYTIKDIPAKRKFYFVQSDESRFYAKGSKQYKMAMATYQLDYEYITEAKWIQAWLKEKFDKDSYYVPNGLDENIIHKVDSISPRGDKIRILLEGSISIPYKGMEDAFNVVSDIDCEVWCVSSSGLPKPSWKCDRFFEKVPMDNMKYIYSSCDVLLKMSRVEGFFGPPLEMMACGGICVVGKVTGYDEYILDGYNALVVEQGDVSGAKRAVESLINDLDLRKKLIANGIKTANKWKWESSIDILEKIFC
ncbi:glycosyltransferase [Clostridium sp. C2-6-12]|uniref:glycosyltransferase n=1 Tax=Clostridium sp. C2-6-12 TaxID=2698832 RepID=UPI00136F7049|nr:glycosyltransferase [Clostridium sp. C2-6-12]